MGADPWRGGGNIERERAKGGGRRVGEKGTHIGVRARASEDGK